MLLKRMAAQPVVVEPLAEPLRLSFKQIAATTAVPESGIPGLAVAELAQRPQTWRLARQPEASDDPIDPDFTRAVTGSMNLATTADVDRHLDLALEYHAAIQQRHADLSVGARVESQILEAELDISSKFTHQYGFRASGMIVDLDPGTVDLPRDWLHTLRELVAMLNTAAANQPPAPAMHQPLDTNAGWPVFRKGLIAKLVSVATCIRQPTVTATLALGEAWSQAAGLPAMSTLSYGLNFRQGPRYKMEPLYELAGGVWTAQMQAKGAWPRARQVFMAPYGTTKLLTPLLARLQAARRGVPGLWHAGDADDKLVSRADAQGWRIAESDISGYDRHVTTAHQEALATALEEVWPDLSYEIRLWLALERRSVVGPSITGARQGASITSTYGGTHSGLLLTAEVGTVIAAATVLTVLTRMMGRSAMREWMSGELLLLVAGDDVLIGTPLPLDSHEWEAHWADCGLPCELLNGRRFLMKHRIGMRSYSVGARVIQQTFFNEHEILVGDVPILQLGALRARLEKGVPDVVREPVERAIAQSNLGSFWNLRRLDDVGVTLQRYDTRYKAALERLASTPWWSQLQRDAPHSPSAARMLAALQDVLPPALLSELRMADAALRSAFERRVDRVLRMPHTERIALAVRLWNDIENQSLNDSVDPSVFAYFDSLT